MIRKSIKIYLLMIKISVDRRAHKYKVCMERNCNAVIIVYLCEQIFL